MVENKLVIKKLDVDVVVRRSDNMWILETRYGDRWTYDENELENATRDQWIFGGMIIHVEDKDEEDEE